MGEDELRDPHVLLALTSIMVVIVVGGVTDLILDQPMPLLSVHVLLEVLLVGFSLTAAAYLGRGWYRAQDQASRLRETAQRTELERDTWKARAGSLREGLQQAVQEQFDDWELTEAERETALMLLGGLSHKAIAKATDRSERTVRQHAVAVYRKAGLAGRAELAAFFLEGLLVSPAEGTESPALQGP